jgi:hypothetical protein
MDVPMVPPRPWTLLALLPMGLLAGLLAGLLGIGGGLVFAPLLLLSGLGPHQALATSTLAIVPTALAGSWTHFRHSPLPWRGALAISLGAALTGALFSRLGEGLAGWLLLALQSLLYGGLSFTIRGDAEVASKEAPIPRLSLPGLGAVGAVAGLASGMLGVGGGLVMVPLMVRLLGLPIHQAIRFSTLAVLASSSTATVVFLNSGVAQLGDGLLLGGTAAVGARWAAARLDRVSGARLANLLRLLTLALALYSGWRALNAALAA